MLDLVEAWFGDFASARARFAGVREDLRRTTLDNVAVISRSLGSEDSPPADFVPLAPFERELALNAYTSSALHDAEAERSANLRTELAATRKQLALAEAALAEREAMIARGGAYVTYRNLRSRLGRRLRG